MPTGCCFHSSISTHVASLEKLCGLKKSKKFGIICEAVIPPGLSSSLWRKVSNSTWCCTRMNFILVIKVTSEFLQRGIALEGDKRTRLDQDGKRAGGNHYHISQASLSTNSQGYVASAPECGLSDAKAVAFISGNPWLHFKPPDKGELCL